MASKVFEAQVTLLVRVLPSVAAETCFALKGGTAINLFIRDLPRLSVDIDLIYLPIEDQTHRLLGYDLRWIVLPRRFAKRSLTAPSPTASTRTEPSSLFAKETPRSRSK